MHGDIDYDATILCCRYYLINFAASISFNYFAAQYNSQSFARTPVTGLCVGETATENQCNYLFDVAKRIYNTYK